MDGLAQKRMVLTFVGSPRPPRLKGLGVELSESVNGGTFWAFVLEMYEGQYLVYVILCEAREVHSER